MPGCKPSSDKKEYTNPTMKDYILGSEEFLIRYYDLLEAELGFCLPRSPTPVPLPSQLEPNSPHGEEGNSPPNSPTSASPNRSLLDPYLQPDPHLDETEEDADMSRNPMDAGLTAHNPATGGQTYTSSTVSSRRLALFKLTRPLASGEKNPLSICPDANTIYMKRSTRIPLPKQQGNNTKKNSTTCNESCGWNLKSRRKQNNSE
jgi:hypothetical protein